MFEYLATSVKIENLIMGGRPTRGGLGPTMEARPSPQPRGPMTRTAWGVMNPQVPGARGSPEGGEPQKRHNRVWDGPTGHLEPVRKIKRCHEEGGGLV